MTVKLNECANRKQMNRVVIYSAFIFWQHINKNHKFRASLNQKKPMKFNVL